MSRTRYDVTSVSSCSRRPCRGRCGLRRRRATVCRRSRTTAARAARMPTGRWRWSLSSAPDRRGLGRGLEVLLGGAENAAELAELPVDAVHPNPRQPRKRFDADAGNGLAEYVLGMLERKQLTEGHARAVLAVPDHEGRRRLAREIVRKGMSVRAAERAARWAGARTKPRRQPVRLDPALVDRAKAAADRLTGFSSRVTRG